MMKVCKGPQVFCNRHLEISLEFESTMRKGSFFKLRKVGRAWVRWVPCGSEDLREVLVLVVVCRLIGVSTERQSSYRFLLQIFWKHDCIKGRDLMQPSLLNLSHVIGVSLYIESFSPFSHLFQNLNDRSVSNRISRLTFVYWFVGVLALP